MSLSLQNDFSPAGTSRYGCVICNIAYKRTRRSSPTGEDRIICTNVEVEWEGWLDICESCVEEAAHLLGMVRAADHEEVITTNQELQRKLAAVSLQVAELQDQVRVLRSLPQPIPSPARPVSSAKR